MKKNSLERAFYFPYILGTAIISHNFKGIKPITTKMHHNLFAKIPVIFSHNKKTLPIDLWFFNEMVQEIQEENLNDETLLSIWGILEIHTTYNKTISYHIKVLEYTIIDLEAEYMK